MKALILIGFLLLGNIKYDNPEFDQYFFRNNFNEEIHEGNLSFYALFNIGDKFGDSCDIPCTNLDTNLYKNKNLGFVLNDLSNKYKFIGGAAFNISPLLNYDGYDLSSRTHFSLNFKYNDTLSLNILGIIAKSERFSIESDSIAFKRLLEIDKYALLPVHRNMKIYYNKIFDLMKDEKNQKLKEQFQKFLKAYPEVAK